MVADADPAAAERSPVPPRLTGSRADGGAPHPSDHTVSAAIRQAGADGLLAEFMKLQAADPSSSTETHTALLEALQDVRAQSQADLIRNQQTQAEKAREAQEAVDSMAVFQTAMSLIVQWFSQELSDSQIGALVDIAKDYGFSETDAKSLVTSMCAVFSGNGTVQDVTDFSNLIHSLDPSQMTDLMTALAQKLSEWYQNSVD